MLSNIFLFWNCFWPRRADCHPVPLCDIITTVQAPAPTSNTARLLSLSANDMKRLLDLFRDIEKSDELNHWLWHSELSNRLLTVPHPQIVYFMHRNVLYFEGDHIYLKSLCSLSFSDCLHLLHSLYYTANPQLNAP